LFNSLIHLAPHTITSETLPGTFPSPDFNAVPKLRISPKLVAKLSPESPILPLLLQQTDSDGPDAEQHKVNLLAMTYGLLGKFANIYTSLDGFIELFQPCVDICARIKHAKLPKELQVRAKTRSIKLGFKLLMRSPVHRNHKQNTQTLSLV
jgi:nucleolar protein 14